eukprot:gene10878-12034_t
MAANDATDMHVNIFDLKNTVELVCSETCKVDTEEQGKTCKEEQRKVDKEEQEKTDKEEQGKVDTEEQGKVDKEEQGKVDKEEQDKVDTEEQGKVDKEEQGKAALVIAKQFAAQNVARESYTWHQRGIAREVGVESVAQRFEENSIKKDYYSRHGFVFIMEARRERKSSIFSKLMGKSQSKIPPSELQDLAKRTYFEVNELKQWYSAFVRDCPSGRLTQPQFIELYNSFYDTPDAEKFAQHVFRTFDINHDNTIDFREFICSLSVTTRGSSEEKLRWAFSIYDIDGNGYISKSEILSIVQSIQKMVGALDDSNASEEKLLKVFTMFDTNKDGQLSLEEFLAGAKKDTTFMQMLQVYV